MAISRALIYFKFYFFFCSKIVFLILSSKQCFFPSAKSCSLQFLLSSRSKPWCTKDHTSQCSETYLPTCFIYDQERITVALIVAPWCPSVEQVFRSMVGNYIVFLPSLFLPSFFLIIFLKKKNHSCLLPFDLIHLMLHCPICKL